MHMIMTAEAQIKDYLELLSSKAPVPGGGGASALAGALGDSLGQMVVHLTLGKKRYAQAEQDMLNYERELKRLQQEFLMLADKDAEVFAPLAECYRLPSSTEEEKAYKEKVMGGTACTGQLCSSGNHGKGSRNAGDFKGTGREGKRYGGQ